MNKIKAKRYYLFRFLGWQFLLGFAFALIGRLAISLFPQINNINNNILVCLVYYFFNLAIGIVIFHIALNKVFFKPYKHITITPNFSKITFWFSLKNYLKIAGIILAGVIVIYLLIFCSVVLIFGHSVDAFLIYSVVYAFAALILLIPVGLFVTLFIINRIVKQNASIELKTQD